MRAGFSRRIVDLEASFRFIDIQRVRDETQTWLEEMAWLLDAIQNGAFDGLEFMLSTKSLDSASVKKLRAEMATIPKRAKVDLLELSSPALGAAICFETPHLLLKNFTQRVIENL